MFRLTTQGAYLLNGRVSDDPSKFENHKRLYTKEELVPLLEEVYGNIVGNLISDDDHIYIQYKYLGSTLLAYKVNQNG